MPILSSRVSLDSPLQSVTYLLCSWTQEAVDVACKQLGFNNGTFSFVSWSRNDTDFMLYHNPACEGSETNILDCPNKNNIQIGHKICRRYLYSFNSSNKLNIISTVQQQTVHLYCEGTPTSNPASDNWWGLEFYNSTYVLESNGNIWINESASTLVNVDIEYAGMDPTRQPVPAIRASPTPPHLINVTIKNCALDGTNFTDVKASTIIHNTLVSNNRGLSSLVYNLHNLFIILLSGHGIVVESHIGRVSITDSLITDNYGNGVKAKFLDGKHAIFDESLTFCRNPDVGGAERFPILISGIPNDFPTCSKVRGVFLCITFTLHFCFHASVEI